MVGQHGIPQPSRAASSVLQPSTPRWKRSGPAEIAGDLLKVWPTMGWVAQLHGALGPSSFSFMLQKLSVEENGACHILLYSLK